jgi:hypothetical protein
MDTVANATPASSRHSSEDAIAALTSVLSAVATNQTTILADVVRLLSRLADAAEQIVTQPKDPAGMWREINGNPAPWNET